MNAFALYVPGSTVLHQMASGWKLLALAGFSGVVLAVPGYYPAAIGLALVFVAFTRVQPPWRLVATPVWITTISSAALATFHVIFNEWQTAVEVSTSLMALVFAALLLTLTTQVSQIIDALTDVAVPVAKLPGIRKTDFTAERFALSVSIMLRALPAVLDIVNETRQAAKARGLERSPRALIIPAVVRTVKYSQRTAEALAARGLD